MGQYKLFIIFKWQLGFLLDYEYDSIEIDLPFICIIIGLTKEAAGYYIFGLEK